MTLGDLASNPQARETLMGLVHHFENGSLGSLSQGDAAQHHDQVAGQLDDTAYQQAAQESVAQLSPTQRDALASHLTSAAPSHGIDISSLLGGQAAASSGGLASILGAIRAQQGTSATTGLLGGGSGLEGEVGKLVMGGIAAAAARRVLGH